MGREKTTGSPEVEKCETSFIIGEERSTVTMSPLVRKRSGGALQSVSCSQSSFTCYLLLTVRARLGAGRSLIKDGACWAQKLTQREKTAAAGHS